MTRCARVEIVPPADRPALLARARAGDRAARDRLVLSVLPLYRTLAARYADTPAARNAALESADLFGEAAARLLREVVKWDPDRGGLTTFARHVFRTAYTVAAGLRSDGYGPPPRCWSAASLPPDLAAPAAGGRDSPVAAAEANEAAARLAEAVAGLGEFDRMIWDQAVMNNEPDRAVGESLGLTRRGASYHVCRVRAKVLAFVDPTTTE